MIKRKKIVISMLLSSIYLLSSCAQPSPTDESKPSTHSHRITQRTRSNDPTLLVLPLNSNADKTLSIDQNVYLTLQDDNSYRLDITKGADIIGDYTVQFTDSTVAQALIEGEHITIKALNRGETTFTITDSSGAISNVASVRIYDLIIMTPTDDLWDMPVDQSVFFAIKTMGEDQREYEMRNTTYNLDIEPGKFIYQTKAGQLSSTYTFPLKGYSSEPYATFALYLKGTDIKLREWHTRLY